MAGDSPTFGKFFGALLASLDVENADAAGQIGVSQATIYNWLAATEAPRGAIEKLARWLFVGPDLVLAAAEGVLPLPAECTDRAKWLIRRAKGRIYATTESNAGDLASAFERLISSADADLESLDRLRCRMLGMRLLAAAGVTMPGSVHGEAGMQNVGPKGLK